MSTNRPYIVRCNDCAFVSEVFLEEKLALDERDYHSFEKFHSVSIWCYGWETWTLVTELMGVHLEPTPGTTHLPSLDKSRLPALFAGFGCCMLTSKLLALCSDHIMGWCRASTLPATSMSRRKLLARWRLEKTPASG